MITVNNTYQPYPYYADTPMYDPYTLYHIYGTYPYPYWGNPPMYHPGPPKHCIKLKDYGPEPFVLNIQEATKQNNTFRTALWTGEYLQLTLMSINPGDDIGLEVHHDHDQFIRIEQGQGIVKMGDKKDMLDFQEKVYDDYAIFIPAGKWHNLINTGCKPLKLYSIYAPPEHPHGTVHETKADAEADEDHHCH
ncbi:cupin domain-containing protein [Alkaliphilus metalliredigens]